MLQNILQRYYSAIIRLATDYTPACAVDTTYADDTTV